MTCGNRRRFGAALLAMVALALSAGGCGNVRVDNSGSLPETGPVTNPVPGSPAMVLVRLAGPDGLPLAPESVPKVVKSDEEWRGILTREQYEVARGRGTERAFCGGLLDNKERGIYACVCCSLPLFSSGAKFESGTGWPSFFQPFAQENVTEHVDRDYGMVRTEILCARCDAHLGHVFDDGPAPSGRRYCLNSAAMVFMSRPSQ